MHQRKIHLIGDSISKGYALGEYEDTLSPSNPLWPLRSISSMANNTLYGVGIKDEFYYTGLPAVNFSSDIEATEVAIRAIVNNGTIRSGDVVIFEDAGPHIEDPDTYQEQWEFLRAAVVDRFDITLVMMSMFSYSPAPNDNRYDVTFGSRTMNAATLAAATSLVPNERGQTLFFDMKTNMDGWETSAYGSDLVPVMLPDGIHPNVWGQARMAGEILKLLRYRPYLGSTVPGLEAVASANWVALAYGSPYFSSVKAATYMRDCLLR